MFNEGGLQSSADQQLVFFDTDFGVRFGLLTCFDIIFKTPGVDLANNYNVTHFVFPTAWFSEMPFLTGTINQATQYLIVKQTSNFIINKNR